MNYLSYLNIKHFKGIEDLELQDLSNINIIVGDNNCGKTSLLEAISLLESQDSIKSMLNKASIRDSSCTSKFELFLEIFPKEQDRDKRIQINSIINGLTRELKIDGSLTKMLDVKDSELENNVFEGTISVKLEDEYLVKKDICLKENQGIKDSDSNNIIKIVYVTPHDHFKYGLNEEIIEKIKQNDKNKIINLLKTFDPNITDFKIFTSSNKKNPTIIYLKHKKYGFMPLFSFGDGIKKVFTLASAVFSAKGGILLIDEIETAIHKNMINDVFKWFIEACKEYEVQLVCTTHSLEAIDAMIASVGEEINALSCFRIELYDDKVYNTKFAGNKLKAIRTLLGQDVR